MFGMKVRKMSRSKENKKNVELVVAQFSMPRRQSQALGQASSFVSLWGFTLLLTPDRTEKMATEQSDPTGEPDKVAKGAGEEGSTAAPSGSGTNVVTSNGHVA